MNHKSKIYNRSFGAKNHWRTIIIVSLVFLLASLIYTYPLCLTSFQKIINAQHDAYGNIWLSWWLKYSQAQGLNTMETNYLYYPVGVNLWETNANFLIPLIVAFFSNFFPLVVSFNIVMLLGLFLSALFTYFLVRYLTHNFYGGIISGLIFGFSPYIYWEIWQGSLELIHTEWIPLYCLFLFKLQKEKSSFWNIILAVFSLTIACLSNWYYGCFLYLLTLLFLFYHIVSLRDKILGKIFIRIILVLVITTAILSPFLFQLEKTLSQREEYKAINWDKMEVKAICEEWQKKNVNLRASEIVVDYLFNRDRSILAFYLLQMFRDFGSVLKKGLDNFGFIGTMLFEHNLFVDKKSALKMYPLKVLGDSLSIYDIFHNLYPKGAHPPHKTIFTYLTITLFILSLLLGNRRRWLYIFIFFIFILLSFGPYMFTRNHQIVPLPSYLLYKFIPQFSLIGGRPYRFAIIALLMVSLSIGELIAFLTLRVKNSYFFLLGFLLILDEVFTPLLPAYPFTFLPSSTPHIYRNFLSSKNYALIEAPIYECPFLNSEYIFYQTFHHKPIFNGFHLSYRIDPQYLEFIKNNIFLRELIDVFNNPEWNFFSRDKKFQYQEAIKELKKVNFKYVVFHAQRIFYNPLAATYGFYFPPPEDEMVRCIRMFEYLNSVLGPPIKFSDGIAIYKL